MYGLATWIHTRAVGFLHSLDEEEEEGEEEMEKETCLRVLSQSPSPSTVGMALPWVSSIHMATYVFIYVYRHMYRGSILQTFPCLCVHDCRVSTPEPDAGLDSYHLGLRASLPSLASTPCSRRLGNESTETQRCIYSAQGVYVWLAVSTSVGSVRTSASLWHTRGGECVSEAQRRERLWRVLRNEERDENPYKMKP